MMQLNVYKLDSKLNFGQYKGQKLINVVKRNPNYLDWCLVHLPGFFVLPEDLEKIRKEVSSAELSDKADYIFQCNLNQYESQKEFKQFVEGNRPPSVVKLEPVTSEELEDLNKRSVLYLLELNKEEYKRRLRNDRWADKYLNEILDDYNQVKSRLKLIKKKSYNSFVSPSYLEELFKRLLSFNPEQQDKIEEFNRGQIESSGDDELDFF